MRKRTGIWLIVAAVLVLGGGMVFGGAMMTLGWDFTKLSTDAFETAEYVIDEPYTHITIDTITADVELVPTQEAVGKVVCYEQKKMKHRVSVENGTLVVAVTDTRAWYEHIGIHFRTPKITVTVPQGEYGALSIRSDTGNVVIPKECAFDSIDVAMSTGNIRNGASAAKRMKLKTTTGSIRVDNVTAGALELTASTGGISVSQVRCAGDVTVRVSTGKTTLEQVTCQNLTTSGNTGSVTLSQVVAEGLLSVKRSTGRVTFAGADAAEIFVETDTGDVRGTLLSDKVFITQTDTGRIDVPKTTTGGKCEIHTATGDISLSIE